MDKCNLKIDPCTTSNTDIDLKSNHKPILCVDNVYQNRKNITVLSNTVSNDFIQSHSTCNSSLSQLLEQNESFKMDVTTFDTDIASIKETLNSSLENILKHKHVVAYVKCEDSNYFRCCICHCLICNQSLIILPTEKNKNNFVNEPKLNYIQQFYCLICDMTMKTLLDWKYHAISINHINKCIFKNGYYSYDCGGCKAVFFGNKDQILNHCKDVHNDLSGLPCIFKCMKEVFYQFIFKTDNLRKCWKFCGMCKRYSPITFKCAHFKQKKTRFKCKSCLINFICSQDVYNKHLVSCEHIMLEHLSVNENTELQNISSKLKLPQIILNKFTIDNKKATCNDCTFMIVLNEKAITDHLSECILKSDIDGKITTNINNYLCAVCNETFSDFSQWNLHLTLSNHLIKCHDSNNLVSYTCEVCLLHCYGNANYVTEHQKIHPNKSEKSLSMYLAFNFQRINKDFKSKELYYCEDCETYAEVIINSDHRNRSHKTKLKRKFCKPCRTEFFCREDNNLFDKHILSSEHIILKYAATRKSLLEFKTSPLNKSKKSSTLNKENKKSDSNSILEIDKSYFNWFQIIEGKIACISCDDLVNMNENTLISHLLVCSQNPAKVISQMSINNFICLECVIHVNNYNTWEKHAISHVKINTYDLYSYICKICNSLLYGKTMDIEFHLNNEHEISISDMPLEIKLITKQLMRKNSNTIKSSDVMCFCEPCQKIFEVNGNYNHFNTNSHLSLASDLVELFYCKYCQIEFYSSITVYECHKLSTEHIKLSLEHGNIDTEIIHKPLQLDVHLLKFVSNEKLYDTTQNIGFFCFVCDYLCLNLDTWKIHINGKKHIKSSKGHCMDYRCKICKTLMFGQRHIIFKHYSNNFHSMLRQFKLVLSTDVLKKNNLVSPNNCEIKRTHNMETISEYNHTAPNENNILEQSRNTINLLTTTMDKISNESNTQQDNKLGEFTSNINVTHSMINTKNEFSLETNTQNYSNFCTMKINMLNDSLNQNKEIKPQLFYYCFPCDYITTIQSKFDDHNLSHHSNTIEVRHQIFCDTCNLYQIGPSDNLNEHINTIEHKNMEDFQKLNNLDNKKNINVYTNEKNETMNNCNYNKPSDVSKTSIIDKQDSKNSEKEKINHKVMIEVKGAKPLYKKNSWVELKKIFSTYGYFRIYPKENSVIIIFRKLSYMQKMLKDKEKLEKIHDFNICVVIEDEKLPELHKITEFEFGNKSILLKAINTQLLIIKQEITNPSIYNRLFLLINSIHRCASQYFSFGKTYAFGSRMSGLALKDSDVDLYFDIGNTFNGLLSNDLFAQEDLVRYFGKVFRSQSYEFKQIQQITGARVPIVKFLHLPSGLNCDLSFKSGLSTHNTKLVRLYLTLDERIHWIVCAVVKHWALQNDLKNQSMFTSYALTWMTLFYLMTIKVVPPLSLLRSNSSNSDIMFIEDWDCTFCTIETAKQIWRLPEIQCWELLHGFFIFYSDPNRLKQYVFCPAIGEAISKENFFDIPLNSRDKLGFYKKRTGNATQWCIKLRDNFHGEGLALQDPFDLFHNITKTIVPRKLQCFSHLCNKTLEVMNKETPYYS